MAETDPCTKVMCELINEICRLKGKTDSCACTKCGKALSARAVGEGVTVEVDKQKLLKKVTKTTKVCTIIRKQYDLYEVTDASEETSKKRAGFTAKRKVDDSINQDDSISQDDSIGQDDITSNEKIVIDLTSPSPPSTPLPPRHPAEKAKTILRRSTGGMMPTMPATSRLPSYPSKAGKKGEYVVERRWSSDEE
jgi:hypothetical protein